MARSLEVALEPHGFEPEHRPYVAHLTLARIDRPSSFLLRRVEEWLETFRHWQWKEFRVPELIWFETRAEGYAPLESTAIGVRSLQP